MASFSNSATREGQPRAESRAADMTVHEQQLQSVRKCHHIKLGRGSFGIELNPVVTILSLAAISGTVAWHCKEPMESLEEMRSLLPWITKYWTWLHVGSICVWAVFIIGIYFSKYSELKLGREDAKPEFNDFQYFTMLFAAGIGVDLLYFGVAEPVYHYKPIEYGNRYWNRYSDNQRAQDAMNLTFLHWGIHAWISYVVVGMSLALVSYRWGLPMSIRSCLYPLLGNPIFGLTGDIIDTAALVCTMRVLSSNLGLRSIMFNTNLNRMNADIPEALSTQFVIIGGITLIATASVVTGLKLGIKLLSGKCLILGTFLMLFQFLNDDPSFVLNSYVQSIGYYLQNIIGVGFHTEAFAQLGIAPDEKENSNWFTNWTMFYWGWWVASAPFVGMFIAKISRGRTLKQFIIHTMVVPVLYSFFWFTVCGTAGIKMERVADLANISCSYMQPVNGLYRPSCRTSTDMWFDLLESSSPNIHKFMFGVSLLAIFLYLVTNFASGTLVIDSLAANGHPDPPLPQRIFWAFTVAACAIGLLIAGREDYNTPSLLAQRVESLLYAMLFVVVLNFMCFAIWRVVQIEAGDLDPNGPHFSHDLFFIFWIIFSSYRQAIKFVIAVVMPWFTYGSVYVRIKGHGWRIKWIAMLFFAVLFYSSITLALLGILYREFLWMGVCIYLGFASAAAYTRGQVRQIQGINGNTVEDFFAVLIYPFAPVQLDDYVTHMEMEVNSRVATPLAYPISCFGTVEGITNPGLQLVNDGVNNDNWDAAMEETTPL